MHIYIIIFSLGLLFAILIFLRQKFGKDEFNFDTNLEPREKKIIINQDDKKIEEYVMETNGMYHSVFLDEIVKGGPRKDGIPSIDSPKFVSIKEASSYLLDSEPGIALHYEGISKFYPFQIMVWHEIVNDNINGKRVLITYCPLCYSGLAFDPFVDGSRIEFGTSGRLWNSNLVVYDRKTNSLWSQILGKAIVGQMTGVKLKRLPSEQLCFRGFKKAYPNGTVLAKDTGFFRFYGEDPYGDYYTAKQIYFPINIEDNRLSNKDFVLGIVMNNRAKAYWIEALQKAGHVEDILGNQKIVAKFDENIGVVNMYEEQENGELLKIYPIPCFWFSWAAAYPYTELYK